MPASNEMTNMDNLSLAGTLAVAGASTLTGNVAVGGVLSLTTPLTSANHNASVRDEEIVIPINSGAILADGVTYEMVVPIPRAGTVVAAYVACGIRIAGGTNTLALAKRNGGTEVTLLSTATVDPTAVPSAAFTAQALTLTSVTADKAVVAGDCLIARLVCGTMTTDGKGYAIVVRLRPSDE